MKNRLLVVSLVVLGGFALPSFANSESWSWQIPEEWKASHRPSSELGGLAYWPMYGPLIGPSALRYGPAIEPSGLHGPMIEPNGIYGPMIEPGGLEVNPTIREGASCPA